MLVIYPEDIYYDLDVFHDLRFFKLLLKNNKQDLIEYEIMLMLAYIGSSKYLFFFWKMLSNFFFYSKVQSFRLIMENNFIQMAALLFV